MAVNMMQNLYSAYSLRSLYLSCAAIVMRENGFASVYRPSAKQEDFLR